MMVERRCDFFVRPWQRYPRLHPVNRVAGYRYDPLFAYDRWYYASRDPNWITNLERWHTYYREHPEARPPHELVVRIVERTPTPPEFDGEIMRMIKTFRFEAYEARGGPRGG